MLVTRYAIDDICSCLFQFENMQFIYAYQIDTEKKCVVYNPYTKEILWFRDVYNFFMFIVIIRKPRQAQALPR